MRGGRLETCEIQAMTVYDLNFKKCHSIIWCYYLVIMWITLLTFRAIQAVPSPNCFAIMIVVLGDPRVNLRYYVD